MPARRSSTAPSTSKESFRRPSGAPRGRLGRDLHRLRDGAVGARELHGVEVRLTPDIIRGFHAGRGDGRPSDTHPSTEIAASSASAWAEWRPIIRRSRTNLRLRFARDPRPRLVSLCRRGRGGRPSAERWTLGADRLRYASAPRRIRDCCARRPPADCAGRLSHLEPAHAGGLSLAEHPLPQLIAAGAVCSVSTDDPALFRYRPLRRLRGRPGAGTPSTRDYGRARGERATTRPENGYGRLAISTLGGATLGLPWPAEHFKHDANARRRKPHAGVGAHSRLLRLEPLKRRCSFRSFAASEVGVPRACARVRARLRRLRSRLRRRNRARRSLQQRREHERDRIRI